MTAHSVAGIALLAMLWVAFPALAHEEGISYEAETDGYTVDIGYSTNTPSVQEAVQFDFRLRSGEETVPFTDVWVAVLSEGDTVFSGGLHNAPFGGTRLNYVFPGPGTYTITARFENAEGEIARGSFDMQVTGSSEKGRRAVPPFLYGILGFFVGAGAAAIILGNRKRV